MNDITITEMFKYVILGTVSTMGLALVVYTVVQLVLQYSGYSLTINHILLSCT